MRDDEPAWSDQPISWWVPARASLVTGQVQAEGVTLADARAEQIRRVEIIARTFGMQPHKKTGFSKRQLERWISQLSPLIPALRYTTPGQSVGVGLVPSNTHNRAPGAPTKWDDGQRLRLFSEYEARLSMEPMDTSAGAILANIKRDNSLDQEVKTLRHQLKAAQIMFEPFLQQHIHGALEAVIRAGHMPADAVTDFARTAVARFFLLDWRAAKPEVCFVRYLNDL